MNFKKTPLGVFLCIRERGFREKSALLLVGFSVILLVVIRHIHQQQFCYNQYMKTLTKTLTAVFIFSCIAVMPVHAENYDTEIITKVEQLQGIIQLMEQNPNLRTMMTPFIISLVSDLQGLVNQKTDAEKDTYNEPKEEKFDVTKTDRYPQQTSSQVTTTAEGINISGADNDYAEFEIEFDISAFGNSAFISENAGDAIIFTIEDTSTGDIVYASNGVQNGNAIVSFSMTADADNRYFRINEGDSEKIIINVTYTPHAGTGVPPGSGSYRLVIDSVEYAFSEIAATDSYTTRPRSKFRTTSVNIID
jgi:fumarate reductase subunit C